MEGFLRYDAYQLLTTLAYRIYKFFSSGLYKYVGFLSFFFCFFISLTPPENIYRFPKKKNQELLHCDVDQLLITLAYCISRIF